MSESSDDDLDSRAALYALDLLDGAERREFEERLVERAAARRLAEDYRATAAALLDLVPPRDPPAFLRARVLDGVRLPSGQSGGEGRVDVSPGVLIVFQDRLPWQHTGLPGVRVKHLYVDQQRKYASSLVRMAAGSVFPCHRHRQLEELFLLRGEVVVSGHRLGPGDYCRAEPGSLHQEVRAETDCTFVALAGLDNDISLRSALSCWLQRFIPGA